MKIVNDLPEDKHEVERQQEERRVPAEYRMDGRIRRKPGHTLFSYNVKTGEWKVADTERKAIVKTDGSVMYRTQVKRDGDCVYIQALNLKNAMKKFQKGVEKLAEFEMARPENRKLKDSENNG